MLKSHIVSRLPTALLSPFVLEPQSQSPCKIDELVHEGLLWVTVEARVGGLGGTKVCVSGDTARLAQVTHSHFQLATQVFFSPRWKRSRRYSLRFSPKSQKSSESESGSACCYDTHTFTRRARGKLFIGSVSGLTPTLTGNGSSSSHLAVFS